MILSAHGWFDKPIYNWRRCPVELDNIDLYQSKAQGYEGDRIRHVFNGLIIGVPSVSLLTCPSKRVHFETIPNGD